MRPISNPGIPIPSFGLVQKDSTLGKRKSSLPKNSNKEPVKKSKNINIGKDGTTLLKYNFQTNLLPSLIKVVAALELSLRTRGNGNTSFGSIACHKLSLNQLFKIVRNSLSLSHKAPSNDYLYLETDENIVFALLVIGDSELFELVESGTNVEIKVLPGSGGKTRMSLLKQMYKERWTKNGLAESAIGIRIRDMIKNMRRSTKCKSAQASSGDVLDKGGIVVSQKHSDEHINSLATIEERVQARQDRSRLFSDNLLKNPTDYINKSNNNISQDDLNLLKRSNEKNEKDETAKLLRFADALRLRNRHRNTRSTVFPTVNKMINNKDAKEKKSGEKSLIFMPMNDVYASFNSGLNNDINKPRSQSTMREIMKILRKICQIAPEWIQLVDKRGTNNKEKDISKRRHQNQTTPPGFNSTLVVIRQDVCYQTIRGKLGNLNHSIRRSKATIVKQNKRDQDNINFEGNIITKEILLEDSIITLASSVTSKSMESTKTKGVSEDVSVCKSQM